MLTLRHEMMYSTRCTLLPRWPLDTHTAPSSLPRCSAFPTRAKKLRSKLLKVHAHNHESGVDDTANAFAGHEASSNGGCEHGARPRVSCTPYQISTRSDQHGRSTDRVWQQKGKTDYHHVWVVHPDPFPLACPEAVSYQHHDAPENSKAYAESLGCWWQGEVWACNCNCYRPPCRHGRGREWAVLRRL